MKFIIEPTGTYLRRVGVGIPLLRLQLNYRDCYENYIISLVTKPTALQFSFPLPRMLPLSKLYKTPIFSRLANVKTAKAGKFTLLFK
ncbi:hypothetical protein HRH59_17835 [Rheinheimera sp. YQF-2]|uniref:Uncharacterized protein n=1 Tax=Rheinheimera lutimaris TaxID=2740584 RepID=A0A7Y5EK11_9GAMM|nr:hypothetical protein [Rheinheimera lutimaris]NRQ44402.1 hypothetical protein [Rheinheimera lutimaris]